MGMSSYVVGIIPPDETWKKMFVAYNACKSAGVEPPKEVMEFFQQEPPDPAGILTELSSKHPAVTRYNAEMQTGFEVDIAKLPKHIKIIRFVNSW